MRNWLVLAFLASAAGAPLASAAPNDALSKIAATHGAEIAAIKTEIVAIKGALGEANQGKELGGWSSPFEMALPALRDRHAGTRYYRFVVRAWDNPDVASLEVFDVYVSESNMTVTRVSGVNERSASATITRPSPGVLRFTSNN